MIADPQYIKQLVNLSNKIIKKIPRDQIAIVLDTIVGNNSGPTRGGLIEDSFTHNRPDLALSLVECAKSYIEKAEKYRISIPFIRGYLADVIKAFNIPEDPDYLATLRSQDDLDNFNYYKCGAQKGNVYSINMLAQYYFEGKGCDQNNEKALYWLSKTRL